MNEIKNILIIDDEYLNHVYLEKMLISLGFKLKFYSAYNGKEALEMLERIPETIHFILCDLNMPVMGGIEFLINRRRTQYGDISLAVITASSNQADFDSIRKLGISYIFGKPISSDNLSTIVQSLFQRTGC